MSEQISLSCFLCNSLDKFDSNYNATASICHFLSFGLDVVYLLTNLLQVPRTYLESQLKECGTNPDSWITLCEQCTHLIRNARELNQQIHKLEGELRSIKKQVVETLKKTGEICKQEKKYFQDQNSSNFVHKLKHFVKEYNYNNLDTESSGCNFLEGDHLAKYLESQAKKSTALLIFDESVVKEEIKVEVDLSSNPSPLPSPSPEDTHLIDGPPDEKLKEEKKIANQKGGKTYSCKICGRELSSSYSLYRHRRYVHKIGKVNKTPRFISLASSVSNWDGSLVCSICGKEFSKKMGILGHIKTVHEKQYNLSCHLCGMGIQSEHQLKLHLLSKHKDDPVAKQLEEEEGIKNIKCPVVGCASKFLKKEALDTHMEKYHKGDESKLEEIDKRFKCQFCGKGFWDKTKLRHHERIHEGQGKDDWKCEICGKGFSTKQYLRYHQLHTHKQAKKFQQSTNSL